MRVLFSPVGKADPLTMLGDGPMLHLVRHFQPDKVILFLSPRMAQYDNKCGNYKRAIELLSNELGRAIPEIEYIYSEIEEAHKYDLYIDKFEEILTQVNEDKAVTELIVNLSSGTPAMGQALLVIHALGRLKLRALQVSTPAKDMNKEGDRLDQEDVDLETLWDLYKEDKHSGNPRWFDVESANLNDLLLRDNIRTLVEKYDYVGASQLATQSGTISQEAKKLIDGCVARMNLDVNAANYFSFFKGTDLAYDPSQKLREYLCVLEVYLVREQWADYVRAMTPALFETVCAYIDKYMNENYPGVEWLLREDQNRLNTDAVRKITPFKRTFDEAYFKGKPSFVMNSDLVELLENLYLEGDNSERDKSSRNLIKKLRDFERRVRNSLSHSICRAERQWLEIKGGMKLEDSLRALFKLNHIKCGLYKDINKKIIEFLYQ